MHEQSYGDNPRGTGNQHSDICAGCQIAVQGVKSYAAPACHINGICQQMVEVYKHGQQEHNINLLPARLVKEISDHCRKYQMQKIMNYKLHNLLACCVQRGGKIINEPLISGRHANKLYSAG